MLFTEFRFFVFFAIVYVVYWMLAGNRQRKVLLLISSYVFYAAWNWKFLILIIASTTIDFLIGLRLGQLGRGGVSRPDSEVVGDSQEGGETPPLQKSSVDDGGPVANNRTRHLWILLSVCWNLGVLGFFKYFNFGISSAAHLLDFLGLHTSLHTLNIILPVGISFFTFQSMSYSIDVYKGQLKPCKNLLDFSTFIGFFPQLFAGPIVRAIDFLPQLESPRRMENVRGRAMVMMFIIGYIKKSCVANNLAPFVDDYFTNPTHYNWLGCWTAVLFYAAQIYCDFSGYTDMAIASAGLLGFEFCQNFDFPYFSPNIGEFWRRWHMSLSSWLRDYLYIPLGGNRGGMLFQYRNLFLTMLLGGLWHGAAWTFIIWGAMHGGALVVHREFRRAKKAMKIAEPTGPIAPKLAAVIATVLTFLWVSLTWVFFRAPGLHIAMATARSFLLFRSPGSADFGMRAIIAFAALAVIHWLCSQEQQSPWWQRIPAWQFAAVCGIVMATALPWTPLRYQPFIYFQF